MLERVGFITTQRFVEPTWEPRDLESLATELQTVLNGTGKAAGMGTYTVTRVSTGKGGATSRAYQIACSAGLFMLPSDVQIRTFWFNGSASAPPRA